MKLKNLFNGLAAIALLATAPRAQAQGDDKLASVDIHTNAVCGDCKERIESEMIYVKGVRSVKVDLTNENIHVEYKAQKTDPAKLREAVAKIGYLADGQGGARCTSGLSPGSRRWRANGAGPRALTKQINNGWTRNYRPGAGAFHVHRRPLTSWPRRAHKPKCNGIDPPPERHCPDHWKGRFPGRNRRGDRRRGDG